MNKTPERALYLSEADVQSVLTMPIALATVERAMKDRSLAKAVDVPRVRTDAESGSLRLLQAAAPELGYIGFKYTYVRPTRRCCFVHLIDIETGVLEAIIDADWLGMMRTGAASGVASRYLANPDVSILGQLGAGRQGYGQLEATCLALEVRTARVYARNRDRLEAFCASMTRKLGIDVIASASAEMAVRDAQVVNVITQSAEPVLHGQWLSAGQHINAAGSNSLSRRELDEEAVRRCQVIVVDGRASAREECGDLLAAVQQGRLAWERLTEIGEVMLGRAEGRSSAGQITLYESHGLGIQDIYVAAKVLELARAAKVGQLLPVAVIPDVDRRTHL